MAHRGILLTGVAMLVVGAVLAAVADATWLAAVGWTLVGVGGVVLVSLAFLLVGESEDRDRLRNPHG